MQYGHRRLPSAENGCISISFISFFHAPLLLLMSAAALVAVQAHSPVNPGRLPHGQ